MVRAWVLPKEGDHKQLDPSEELLDTKALYRRTGVEYFKVNADDPVNDGCLKRIRDERGYHGDDILLVQKTDPNYNETMDGFWQEHLHQDEEIRLMLGGELFFDVRDVRDNWIRIQLTKGDMLVLPPGIYHRGILGPDEYMKVGRYFSKVLEWKAYQRPADDMPCRHDYRRLMEKIAAQT